MANDDDTTAIPAQAIIVICLVGAGFLVLMGYAVGRHYYASEPRELDLQGEVHDGHTQAQYMRMVRMRNQEDLQRSHGLAGNDYRKHPLSSVHSAV